MPNAIATPTVFAQAGLVWLKNSLVMGRLVNTDYTKEFRKIGDTVKVKRPPSFLVGNGRVAKSQDVIEGSADVRIDRQKHIKVKFTSFEDTLSVDALLKSKVLGNAMAQLGQQVDSDLLATFRACYSTVGTLGTAITTPAQFFRAPQRLDNMAVPSDERVGVLYPDDYWGLASYFTGTTQMTDNSIGRSALEKAMLPLIGDVQPYKSQSVLNHIFGSWATAGAITVKGAGQSVTYSAVKETFISTLRIQGASNGATFNVGDVFTIAGVFAINPRTKARLNYLQQFVVSPGPGLANYVASTLTDVDGSTYTDSYNGTYTFSTAGLSEQTINISPPIIVTGAEQTVSAAPADGAVITISGTANSTTPQNLVFHRNAITLATADLVLPFTGEAAIASDPDTGLSIRYWRYSDGDNDEHAHRFDILYTALMIDNRLATRVGGG
jgi:hypothetical protein